MTNAEKERLCSIHRLARKMYLALLSVQWGFDRKSRKIMCPYCNRDGFPNENAEHEPDCVIGKAIQAYDEEILRPVVNRMNKDAELRSTANRKLNARKCKRMKPYDADTLRGTKVKYPNSV